MKQGLDLNAMGLVPMDQLEMQNLDGGNGIINALIRIFLQKAIDYTIDTGIPKYNKTLIKLGPSAMDAAVMFN